MRRDAAWRILLLVALACSAACAGEPPAVLLHLPFDGSMEPSHAAVDGAHVAYIDAAFRPGRREQAAEIGSARFPLGLVVHAPGLLDRSRGSLELWYKPLWDPSRPDERAVRRILATDEGRSASAGHFWLTIKEGSLQFIWQSVRTAGTAAPVEDWKRGQWHHIVATWEDEQGIALFVDSKKVAERNLRWDLPPSDRLYIGADRHGQFPARGLIDEVRVYDRPLDAEEVEVAFVQDLQPPAAPSRPAPEREERAPPGKEPRLTLHLPFDGELEAKVAAGQSRPVVAEEAGFAQGLLGQALRARSGVDLAYAFEGNASKEAGTIVLWARRLEEAEGNQCVLVADAREPEAPEAQKANALGLWVQRERVPQIWCGIRPAKLAQRASRWREGDWHHVALTWQRGREMRLFLNGRLVGYLRGRAARWEPEPSKLLCIGSVHGKLPAEALIDEVRVYDAPLSAQEVARQARQFLLPFRMQLRPTLYELAKPAELTVRLHNDAPDAASAKITVRVANSEREVVATKTARVSVPSGQAADVRLELTRGAFTSEGVYQVALSSPGKVAPPVDYFLVVPPERPMPATEGEQSPKVKLRPIDSIECTRLPSPERFTQSGPSRVVETRGGSFLEAGPHPEARFAFRFGVPDAGHPYVVVVNYPDDRPRSAEVLLTSRNYPNSLDVATGYLLGEHPPTRKMRSLPLYFWPREQENAVLLRTLEPGKPAACSQISVFRVLGVLPSTSVDCPADGGRGLGLYWAHPTLTSQFGARAPVAPEIYRSVRRLADYMRFSGQNVLTYPVVWSDGALYPSPREGFRLSAAAETHCNDWVDYVLYLFERRALRFVPEIVLDQTYALADKYGRQADAAIVAGEDTARTALWDGTLSHGLPAEPPRYNPLHPDVRAALLGHVDEILARYGHSPALEGISLRLGEDECVWFGSIQCGYGDRLVEAFERETGIDVPGANAGGGRFAQRARWLLHNQYDAWVAWRCRKLHELYAGVAERLTRCRPDLRLYLTLAVPDSTLSNPLANPTALLSSRRSLAQFYREAGLDTSLFADAENVVVRKVIFPVDPRYLLYEHGEGGPLPHRSLAGDVAYLSEASAPFRAGRQAAAALVYRRFTSAIGRLKPMPRFWWSAPSFRASHPAPTGRYFLEPYAHAVAELDALSVAAGGNSVVTLGRDDAVQRFARAYRALPRRHFRDVPGMSDPVCARQLRDGDAHYVYLVNRLSFPVDAYLAFGGDAAELRDLATGGRTSLPLVKGRELPAALPDGFVSEHELPEDPGPLPGEGQTQKVTGSLLVLRLEPYELRSYRVLTRGAEIVYGAGTIPDEQRLRLAQRIESARNLVAASQAGDEVLGRARATLALVDRAWAKREYARVIRLLESYPLARLR
ncbi:MAG: LamG-like jellyroll fold domain-containing protein [Candidatus Brocadiia bacterium]